MPDVLYRDLAEFGLPFIPAADPSFATLLEEIRRHAVFPWSDDEDLEHAAVLVNRSGKPVLDFGLVWRSEGGGITRFGPNPAVLSRRPERMPFPGILPGSKRLVTPGGVYGTNADVLPTDTRFGMTGRGFGGRRPRGSPPRSLQLDVALFDDGLCVGPDECGLFEAATRGLDEQRRLCTEIIAMLRAGAGVGAIFEKLRPLVRHRPARAMKVDILQNFARGGIHFLIENDAGLIAFFEQQAEPPRVHIHRPEQPSA